MKARPQYLPPLQSVIYAHTRRMFDQTAMNAQSFAMALAEKYLAMTAPDVRSVPFRLGDDLAGAIKHNAQIVRRYMDGTVRVLPADLIDAWVLTLPDPYRNECDRDLSRRRGFLPVRMAGSSCTARTVCVADLAAEFAQLLEAIAPALEDGRIDGDDLVSARRILNESEDLIAAVMAIRRQVQSILPGTQSNADA
jgi:hypothetical protein